LADPFDVFEVTLAQFVAQGSMPFGIDFTVKDLTERVESSDEGTAIDTVIFVRGGQLLARFINYQWLVAVHPVFSFPIGLHSVSVRDGFEQQNLQVHFFWNFL
jgi:hypothetical protein